MKFVFYTREKYYIFHTSTLRTIYIMFIQHVYPEITFKPMNIKVYIKLYEFIITLNL